MNEESIQRFLSFRENIFKALDEYFEEDSYCKSYEGALAIHFPNYFDDKRDGKIRITLDCYVLGPMRHYDWEGTTLDEALDKAEDSLNDWIQEWKDNQ